MPAMYTNQPNFKRQMNRYAVYYYHHVIYERDRMQHFIEKKLQKAFAQYGRDLEVDPLTEEEHHALYQTIMAEKKANESCEWFEVIEDTVYDYITNKM